MAGGRPQVTEESILNSTHAFDTTLRTVVDKCLAFDPKDRPTAQQVADMIRQAIVNSEHIAHDNDTMVRATSVGNVQRQLRGQ